MVLTSLCIYTFWFWWLHISLTQNFDSGGLQMSIILKGIDTFLREITQIWKYILPFSFGVTPIGKILLPTLICDRVEIWTCRPCHKQCRIWPDWLFRSCLIWVCIVCICHLMRQAGVWNFLSFTIHKKVVCLFFLLEHSSFDVWIQLHCSW